MLLVRSRRSASSGGSGEAIELAEGGAIRGTVVDASGSPVKGALVVASIGLLREGPTRARAQVRTGPGGGYELTGLPAQHLQNLTERYRSCPSHHGQT